MENFYKIIDNDYIVGFGTNGVGDVIEITENEYDGLCTVFHNRPTPPSGYDYRLKTNLEWELYETEEPDLDDAEVFEILIGGAE